jgi:hypothetical protein
MHTYSLYGMLAHDSGNLIVFSAKIPRYRPASLRGVRSPDWRFSSMELAAAARRGVGGL